MTLSKIAITATAALLGMQAHATAGSSDAQFVPAGCRRPSGRLGAHPARQPDPFPRGLCAKQQTPRAGDARQAGQERPACHASDCGGAYASRTPRRDESGGHACYASLRMPPSARAARRFYPQPGIDTGTSAPAGASGVVGARAARGARARAPGHLTWGRRADLIAARHIPTQHQIDRQVEHHESLEATHHRGNLRRHGDQSVRLRRAVSTESRRFGADPTDRLRAARSRPGGRSRGRFSAVEQ